MTESRHPPSGCAMFGIYSSMFRRRRSASMTSLHRINGSPDASSDAEAEAAPAPVQVNPAHRKAGVNEDSSLMRRPNALPMPVANGAVARAAPPGRDRSRPAKMANGTNPAAEYTGMAAELDKMLLDHQKVKGTTQLVRATSGNMMLHRNLGNLNAGASGASARNSVDRNAKAANERKAPNGYAFSGMGNIVKEAKPEGELCRALSHRTDPEKLKEMGNEEYRQGHYAEAVALYDQAIMMDARRPAYWSNKAAALAALGRLIEAVGDCKEAVRIDPSYDRAHHRLGGLYLRLGEPDKAIHHFKQSPKESTGADVSRAQSVKSRIAKCNDARKLKNWITVLQESQAAVSDGTDCAPQMMALQAEALLRLQRHDEADAVFGGAVRFGVDESTKLFGTIGHAYVLIVRAQVDMAAGRFEEAVATAQTACQLDPSNREVANVHRRAKAAAAARLRGNDLFKASKFAEACAAYGEGLDREPSNAVLLCNRAACHAKLGRHEKAVEDCSGALAVRPAYSKARLRRADCNVKLERWEASLRDYQVLIQELPENEDVKKALSEVEAKLKNQRNGAASGRYQN
ncbi:TPR repeat-containing thioredoxin TTL4-like [Phragmites australis]|uniref:TPR repeat-containing thioredoxin TTL4-like n=1 Tax=Phragmites australis TaxID=29695 RepID=UPI002D79CC68|nr:TPR repeat-containing thioredoxin TTL4-like [Phragmites australis]XP_062220965.1 TPR repeat-containing thioredoxin TTL4-like [Phragmites australis]